MKNNWQQQAIELWGDRWISHLARTAGISKRTIQRWNAGQEPNAEIISNLNETYEVWREENV